MNEWRRKFLEEMDKAAEELEGAQTRFLTRVSMISTTYAASLRGETAPAQAVVPAYTVEPVVVSREEVEGGEETLEPVVFGQTFTPTPAPPPVREVAPAKPDNRKVTPEGDALTVYTTLAERHQLGEKWSLETFRGHVRQALALGRIGEERFQEVLKAGGRAGYWHKTMDGKTVMVALGRRPAGDPTPAPLPAEQAGEKLASETTDWEVELRDLLEATGRTEAVINLTVQSFYEMAGARPDNLHLQHYDVVDRLKTVLSNKVHELRERAEKDAAERALSGVEA